MLDINKTFVNNGWKTKQAIYKFIWSAKNGYGDFKDAEICIAKF